MACVSLLGPPEIYVATPSRRKALPMPAASSEVDPFMHLMVAEFNEAKPPARPATRETEKGSTTFLSSGNPAVDLFFQVVPDTLANSLDRLLAQAWAHNPSTTLKLIFNLRSFRGNGYGKADEEGFFRAVYWLHNNHPLTLACNVRSFPDFGLFRDLPEFLYRLIEGINIRELQKEERRQQREAKKRRFSFSGPKSKRNRLLSKFPREVRIKIAMERAKAEQEEARALRKEKKVSMAKKVIDKYSNDGDFRFLYDRISDLFAECLIADLRCLESDEVEKISLAAHWCPSIDSSFDRSTLLCESIARKVFPRESGPEYQGIEEANYVYRVRDRLRKQVLVPLRKVLKTRVPVDHGPLFPHKIIASLDNPAAAETAERQWGKMVERLLEKGKLKGCLPICDVSGGMQDIPMKVSLALGLLVSELCEEPWKGKLITFGSKPQLHLIQGNDLRAKTEFVREMEWGEDDTNFQQVFDLILQVAVNGNLRGDQMVKRVFVFSSMEFDKPSARKYLETDFELITRKFTEMGFGFAVPQIIFWNLRDSKSTPVTATQNGAALVSGYSENLIKLFLENDGDIKPEAVMEAAISGEEYHKLDVLD